MASHYAGPINSRTNKQRGGLRCYSCLRKLLREPHEHHADTAESFQMNNGPDQCSTGGGIPTQRWSLSPQLTVSHSHFVKKDTSDSTLTVHFETQLQNLSSFQLFSGWF